jgi:uncharacterized iron-regulated membrane protein
VKGVAALPVPTVAAPAARPAQRRSLWWVVHSWTGLKLSLFMSWVLLTGTLAVFSVEMDWLARPALRAMPVDAPPASWGTLAFAAQGAVPGGQVTSIDAPIHGWFAAQAMARTADDRLIRVYLDPHDGHVRGTGQWLSFQRFFREMHRHLLLPAKYGIPIVSSLSILLLVSLVTGLVSYKKFWRGFLRAPRPGNARRLTGDLHRLAGLWSLWFVALIALTGLWYLVESLGGDAPYARAPELAEVAPPPIDAARIDRLAALAQATYPTLDIRGVSLPVEPGEPIGFFGQADALLVRDRVNGVWLDPVAERVVSVVRGEELSVHQRISEMADPLHFGTWGGMATKVVWLLFGLLMTGLSVTGVMIYSLRLKGAYDAVPGRAGGVRRAVAGMGVAFYPSAGLVLLSLAMLPGWLAG